MGSSVEEWSLKLPYDHSNLPNTSYSPARVDLSTKDVLAITPALANQSWTFVVAACIALFYRYTGQERIPFHLNIFPSDGSEHSRLPLCIPTNGTLLFGDLEKHLQKNIFHDTKVILPNYQLSITVKELARPYPPSEAKIFEDELYQLCENDQSDLHIVALLGGNKNLFTLQYNLSLFEAGTIDRLGGNLVTLIKFAAQHKNTTLAGLKIYDDQAINWYSQINSGGHKDLGELMVHQEIENHSDLQGDKVAVQSKHESKTYKDLNQDANRLGYYLLSKGIQAESPVIVCLEPSCEVAVALLAVLKIGATYIPLNPSHPTHRIQTMMMDTSPSMVITESSLTKEIDFGKVPTITLDTISEDLQKQPVSNLNQLIDEQQTAYIYYTSGTTGKPKGSMGSFKNLNHYIGVAREKYGFNSTDVMPSLASYTFSISMFELLSPLVAGGTLRIMDRQQVLDVASLTQMLQEVTFVHAGPSLLKNIVKYIKRNNLDYSLFSKVRHLSSGGDMVPPELLEQLRQIFKNTEIFVIYGCTEIACMGCTYPIDPGQPILKTYVGKPFHNVFINLLDGDGNIVPIGVSGEVCIGGNGVGKGYLNRPDLSAEKFFHLNGVRFYRTGDVGRLTAKGNLEMLGRSDFQVQIRGMRVELGEVEYHLRQAPGVRDGVVIARPHIADTVLAAYFVVEDSCQVSSETLRAHLSQFLPDYMVPAFYKELDAMPLNVNMKLDRKALLKEDLIMASAGKEPVTSTEIKMAAIWRKLLKLDHVGIDNNFLALGGDSLLAMELIYLVEEQLHVKLDGMDILRESLQVLSSICDNMLGRQTPLKDDDTMGANFLVRDIKPLESFFFGPENSLYGLFHPGQGLPGAMSVLICPPIGGEYKRCYFLLKLIADTLSAKGITVMRFDYFGTGDSFDVNKQITVEGWQNDIKRAYEELQARKKGRVTLLGVRLGALLAFNALEMPMVDRYVLWDPVIKGSSYYLNQSRLHKRIILRAMFVRNRRIKHIQGRNELLGFTYSDKAIEQLKALTLEEGDLLSGKSVHQLFTKGVNEGENIEEWTRLLGNSSLDRLDVRCDWDNPGSLNTAITNHRILMQLIKLIMDQKP